LLNYIEDPEWGDPKNYDFTVVKTKENDIVKYAVKTSPHKPLPQEISDKFNALKISLDALFTGADPFENNTEENTPLMQSMPKDEINVDNIPLS
jgi:hypothetical protein